MAAYTTYGYFSLQSSDYRTHDIRYHATTGRIRHTRIDSLAYLPRFACGLAWSQKEVDPAPPPTGFRATHSLDPILTIIPIFNETISYNYFTSKIYKIYKAFLKKFFNFFS